jgi:hypothetical protein
MVTISMIDLVRLLSGIPSGDWAALSEDGQAVVACGPDRRSVLQQAQDRGERNTILLWVAPEIDPIVS